MKQDMRSKLEIMGIVGLAIIGSFIISDSRKCPDIPDNTPVLEEYTAHMEIFQKHTGKDAYGFSIVTDADDIGLVCYLDRPLNIGGCRHTIPVPTIK